MSNNDLFRKLLSCRFQLPLITLSALMAASLASHAVVGWLGIRTGAVSHRILGSLTGAPAALDEGSSLMLDGLSWQRISKELGIGIENWFVAGSSPVEWEALQSRSPEARLTFIAISAYDLNEEFLCDYRAGVVPLAQSVRDLRECEADWQFSKRVLSLYPREYLRVLFPTVGRSDGVITGLRDLFRKWASPWIAMKSEAGPAIASGASIAKDEIKTEKVTDWSEARLLRRMTLMRVACGGRHTFEGPKKLALLRMLRGATQQGRAIVAVLPVSPFYAREFLAPEVVEQFETTLAEVQRDAPEARWVRLDRIPELHLNGYFWDLVHMNSDGQRIATEAFLSALRSSLSTR